MNSHKLVIVGDVGVGKTAFIKQGLTKQFSSQYIATQEYKLNSISFHTNNGDVNFEVRDIAGQEKFGDQKDNFQGIECAIVMFDVTSRLSFRNVKPWVGILRKFIPGVPIVLCGNKCDIINRKIKEEDIVKLVVRF